MAGDALDRSLSRLARHLDEVGRLVREEPAVLDLRVERVSSWSVGLQLDHILKVLEAGQRRLNEGSAPLPRRMNLIGRIVLSTGFIPRGIGKSPRGVLPEPQVPGELADRAMALRAHFCERPLSAEARRDPRPLFPHPYFGGLTVVQGLRFLEIHTHHHLKIVADIRRAGGTA